MISPLAQYGCSVLQPLAPYRKTVASQLPDYLARDPLQTNLLSRLSTRWIRSSIKFKDNGLKVATSMMNIPQMHTTDFTGIPCLTRTHFLLNCIPSIFCAYSVATPT